MPILKNKSKGNHNKIKNLPQSIKSLTKHHYK
jgi:hypothetical protein